MSIRCCCCFFTKKSVTVPSTETFQKLLTSKTVKSGHAMIRVIGGLTRYRIIVLLKNVPSGLTVTGLARILDASPSQVSHQIRILKKYHLVFGNPSGRTVTYRLNAKLVEPFLI